MIHYHGGPITPQSAALNAWKGAHAMISFAHPDQVELAAEVCQSFALDNGAFSKWRSGEEIDSTAFDAWIKEWMRHPGFDFYIIPDVIDGDEKENDAAICHYRSHQPFDKRGVPVWHLHETITRLRRLATTFDMVALGSSGQYSTPGSDAWWNRMAEAMDAVCDGAGRPAMDLIKRYRPEFLRPTSPYKIRTLLTDRLYWSRRVFRGEDRDGSTK